MTPQHLSAMESPAAPYFQQHCHRDQGRAATSGNGNITNVGMSMTIAPSSLQDTTTSTISTATTSVSIRMTPSSAGQPRRTPHSLPLTMFPRSHPSAVTQHPTHGYSHNRHQHHEPPNHNENPQHYHHGGGGGSSTPMRTRRAVSDIGGAGADYYHYYEPHEIHDNEDHQESPWNDTTDTPLSNHSRPFYDSCHHGWERPSEGRGGVDENQVPSVTVESNNEHRRHRQHQLPHHNLRSWTMGQSMSIPQSTATRSQISAATTSNLLITTEDTSDHGGGGGRGVRGGDPTAIDHTLVGGAGYTAANTPYRSRRYVAALAQRRKRREELALQTQQQTSSGTAPGIRPESLGVDTNGTTPNTTHHEEASLITPDRSSMTTDRYEWYKSRAHHHQQQQPPLPTSSNTATTVSSQGRNRPVVAYPDETVEGTGMDSEIEGGILYSRHRERNGVNVVTPTIVVSPTSPHSLRRSRSPYRTTAISTATISSSPSRRSMSPSKTSITRTSFLLPNETTDTGTGMGITHGHGASPVRDYSYTYPSSRRHEEPTTVGLLQQQHNHYHHDDYNDLEESRHQQPSSQPKVTDHDYVRHSASSYHHDHHVNDGMDTSQQQQQQHLHYGRVEIETPTPARVKDLKQKLWDTRESLHRSPTPAKAQIQPIAHVPSIRSKLWDQNESLQVAHGATRTEFALHCRQQSEVADELGHSLLPSSERLGRSSMRGTSPSSTRVTAYFSTPREERRDSYHSRNDCSKPSVATPTTTATTITNTTLRSRSLSPKSTRSHDSINGHVLPTTKSAHVMPVQLPAFSPKFVQAAHRGLRSPNSSLTNEKERVQLSQQQSISPQQNKQREQLPQQPRIDNEHGLVAQQQQEQHLMNHRNAEMANPDDPTTVAKLVAKLAAVRRDDPSQALAQIDAILSAQSTSSSVTPEAKVVTRPRDPSPHMCSVPRQETPVADVDHNDGEGSTGNEDCDDTTVSSITNPTYQGGPMGPGPIITNKQRSVLSSFQKSHSITIAQRRNGHRVKSGSPPPETIGVKKKEETIVDSTLVANTSSDDLAEKIRRWDEMSTLVDGERRAEPDAVVTNTRDRSLTPGRRRPHPWDENIPVRLGRIQTQDTSMSNALGVETEFTPKYPLSNENDEPDYRRLRKERVSREKDRSLQSKIVSSSSGEEAEREKQRTSNVVKIETPIYSSALNEEWGLTPAVTKQQQEHAREMSDQFDSAWVSLPASAYFRDRWVPKAVQRNEASAPLDPRRQVDHAETQGITAPDRHAHTENSFNKSVVNSESERSAEPQRPTNSSEDRKQQTILKFQPQPVGVEDLQGTAYDQSMPLGTSSSGETAERGVEVTLTTPSTPPRRGGFRSLLMKRRPDLNKNTIVLGESSNGRSSSRSRKGGSRGLSFLADVDLCSMEEAPPPLSKSSSHSKRHSRNSLSPDRERARSLEEPRIRNPNIARKFNRLLRVYDTDNSQRGNC